MNEVSIASRWSGLTATTIAGSAEEIQNVLPNFSLTEFTTRKGVNVYANPRLMTVIREPLNVSDDPLPIAIVSRNYQLIQHRQVFALIQGVLKAAVIPPDKCSQSISITEGGERMRLTILFPDDPAYSLKLDNNNDTMRLRLQCFNSVDGSMRFMAFLGWFRFVCSNGLVIGRARVDVRKIHRRGLEIGPITELLRNGLQLITQERKTYLKWKEMVIPPDCFVRWVDGPLRKRWGVKLAARAFHIVNTGCDGELDDRFQPGRPTQKSMRSLDLVPGITKPLNSAFNASQILSWLAKERPDVQEQLERMQQVPALMAALLQQRRN